MAFRFPWALRLPWNPASRLRDSADALVSIAFPAPCRICQQLLCTASRIPICQACLDSFQKVPFPQCEKCGAPLENFPPIAGPESRGESCEPILCGVCRVRPFSFDRARSFGLYADSLVPAILLLKFDRIEPLGHWFAMRLQEVISSEQPLFAAQVVVPVPLHRVRQKERGYNQADIIAKPLAKYLSLPYQPNFLVRTRPRPDKLLTSDAERWASVRGAFATLPGSQVDNLRVLLVDDVMTTGATLNACSKALRKSGASSVIGLTVARAARRPLLGSAAS